MRIQIVPTSFVLRKKLARPKKKLTARPRKRWTRNLNLKRINVCGKKRTASSLKMRSSTRRRLA